MATYDSFITSYINYYAESPVYQNSYGVSSDSIDSLFSSTASNSQDKLDSLSGTILGQGIDFFTDGNYQRAIQSFKSAAALSPGSDNAFNAYDYIAQAYVKLEDTDSAIKTYQQAIAAFAGTTDDTFHVALGDLYLQKGNTDDAIDIYEKAINLDPNNSKSRYSLGESYLSAGNLDKAYEQFSEVVRISSKDPAGYYGLGEVARAEGDLSEAILKFKKAISLNKDFELAYRDLGYAYADQGDIDKAKEQLTILEDNSSDYASTLETYITNATKPQITGAYSLGGFRTSLGPKTQVSTLSSKLTDANSSKLFSMTFTFSKEMDESSVIKSSNWTISRATLLKNGGVYNYGMKVSSKEASIASTPAYVLYDDDTQTATVYFRISQNEDANATIDPKHIVFKFSGVDAYDKSMDTSADEYSGFSGIA